MCCSASPCKLCFSGITASLNSNTNSITYACKLRSATNLSPPWIRGSAANLTKYRLTTNIQLSWQRPDSGEPFIEGRLTHSLLCAAQSIHTPRWSPSGAGDSQGRLLCWPGINWTTAMMRYIRATWQTITGNNNYNDNRHFFHQATLCLLYTSDAADD